MTSVADDGEQFTFEAPVVHWRGPAPFVFAQLPPEAVNDVADRAAELSYGWGVIPVRARIALAGAAELGAEFTTSLFPREGGYLLPLKLAARRPLDLVDAEEGTLLSVEVTLG